MLALGCHWRNEREREIAAARRNHSVSDGKSNPTSPRSPKDNLQPDGSTRRHCPHMDDSKKRARSVASKTDGQTDRQKSRAKSARAPRDRKTAVNDRKESRTGKPPVSPGLEVKEKSGHRSHSEASSRRKLTAPTATATTTTGIEQGCSGRLQVYDMKDRKASKLSKSLVIRKDRPRPLSGKIVKTDSFGVISASSVKIRVTDTDDKMCSTEITNENGPDTMTRPSSAMTATYCGESLYDDLPPYELASPAPAMPLSPGHGMKKSFSASKAISPSKLNSVMLSAERIPRSHSVRSRPTSPRLNRCIEKIRHVGERVKDDGKIYSAKNHRTRSLSPPANDSTTVGAIQHTIPLAINIIAGPMFGLK